MVQPGGTTSRRTTGVRCGDGLAVDADLVAAAESATRAALLSLGGAAPDLALVFVCGAEPDDVAAALERAGELSGATTAIGCSAPGVIGGGRGVELDVGGQRLGGALPGVAAAVVPPRGAAHVGVDRRRRHARAPA